MCSDAGWSAFLSRRWSSCNDVAVLVSDTPAAEPTSCVTCSKGGLVISTKDVRKKHGNCSTMSSTAGLHSWTLHHARVMVHRFSVIFSQNDNNVQLSLTSERLAHATSKAVCYANHLILGGQLAPPLAAGSVVS